MSTGREAGSVRRIGLFGGSFDPVHRGHLHAARAAARAFELTRVVFVPAAESPHKTGVRMASGAHRTAMLELAIRGEAAFSVSTLELERGGPSYTIDTVRELPRAIGEAADCALYLIVGSDNLALLPTWREAGALLARVQPIVIHRAGTPRSTLADLEARFGAATADKLRAGYLDLPPVEASSTEARARLPRGVADGLELDPAVLAYIRAHGLYGVAS
jgi:nicotinate-nucleotide adenylyltransferase